MIWILFSILAAFTWSISNIIDKYIFTRWIEKPTTPIMIMGIVGLIASLIVFLRGTSKLSLFNITLALIAGILYVLMIIFYFKAVKREEVSRVIPMFHLNPFFILIFAAIFLGEIFTPIKYSGIFLLITGAILISSKYPFKFDFGKSFWFMILASLIMSVNAIIIKYLLNFADFWTIFAYERIGAFLATIPIFYLSFQELASVIKTHGKKTVGVITLSELLNVVGLLFSTVAISAGYVTLVSSLLKIQPFFVLIFATLLSTFYPHIFKEKISKQIVLLKMFAIILIFTGAILIT